MLGRDKIGEWFETGDRVTQSQFTKTHQSFINMVDDDMYADGKKNIGIGTDTPDTKLHINGDTSNENDEGILKLSDSLGSGTNLRLGITSAYSWMQSHGAKPLKINPSGNNVIINENAGNVGIGESSPAAKLEIKDLDANENSDGVLKLTGSSASNLRLGVTSGYSWIQSHGATPLKINPSTFGNDVIINEHAGNVGIGVSVPANKLHIDNSTGSDTGIRLTNNADINRVLVSDNVGNASWKSLTDEGLAGTSLTPIGIIVMWSGGVTPTAIPTGWKLCDGNGGVAINGLIIPDLSGRFIVGYKPGNSDYNMNTYGPPVGDTDHYTLNNDGEKITLKEPSMPWHRHSMGSDAIATSANSEHDHSLNNINKVQANLKGHWQHGFAKSEYEEHSGYNTATDGSHSHKVTGNTNYQGGNKPHENRPPYYVLAFIIKIQL